MKFQPAAGSPYQPVTEETTAQAYAARGVTASEPLGFTLSGTGELPRDSDAAQGQSSAQGQRRRRRDSPAERRRRHRPAGSGLSAARPGGGIGVPIDPQGINDPWAKYKWWIIGGLGLLLAAGAGFMLKQPVPAASRLPAPGAAAVRRRTGRHARTAAHARGAHRPARNPPRRALRPRDRPPAGPHHRGRVPRAEGRPRGRPPPLPGPHPKLHLKKPASARRSSSPRKPHCLAIGPDPSLRSRSGESMPF